MVLRTTSLARDPAHLRPKTRGIRGELNPLPPGSRPGMHEPVHHGHHVSRSRAHGAEDHGAVKENRTPVTSLARSHTTTVLPPQRSSEQGVVVGWGSDFDSDNPRPPAHSAERRGVAPRYLLCKSRVLLLDDRPKRMLTARIQKKLRNHRTKA